MNGQCVFMAENRVRVVKRLLHGDWPEAADDRAFGERFEAIVNNSVPVADHLTAVEERVKSVQFIDIEQQLRLEISNIKRAFAADGKGPPCISGKTAVTLWEDRKYLHICHGSTYAAFASIASGRMYHVN